MTATYEPTGLAPLRSAAYDDRDVFAEEQRRLFTPGRGLLYVGHDALLPASGHRRADGDPRLVLSVSDTGVRALANVCTHACRPILLDDEPVARRRLSCGFHGWSFEADGAVAGTHGLALPAGPERDRLALSAYATVRWHGFHFVVDPDEADGYARALRHVDDAFAAHGVADWLDLDGWTLVGSTDEVYEGDWKLFLEVYGDCYHVPPYHPGLASFVDCDGIEWDVGPEHHVQFLPRSNRRGDRSPLYGRWADGLDAYHAARGEPSPTMGVAWAALYPNLMIEAYAGLRVVSVVVPDGAGRYVNRVHRFVPGDLDDVVPGLAAAVGAAYDETATEDRALVDARRDGLRTAASLGLPFDRYRAVLGGRAPEAGVAHFHDWYRARMA